MLVGKTLGKYRIVEHIGRGGMAEVYKAYQPGLDRYVAIKVLHSFLAVEADFLTRFQREAKVAAMLRHPNIVQVYDFDYSKEDDAYYMVMEFIEGPTLKQRLQELSEKGELLPLEEAVSIVAAIANALDYAHQHGMVHRDVKPANIMFTRDGQPVLTDFGIARMVDVVGLTASGTMVGTPAYMAPEQGMGQAGDERSDIYSLGVVLYQLTTGYLPYDADTPLGVAMKHISEPLPPPAMINTAMPANLEAVIMRALAKAPENRYQTAHEFAADLKRAISGQHIEPVPSEHVAISRPQTMPPTLPLDQMATLPSAPAVRLPPTPPAGAARGRRRWTAAVLAILALIMLGGCVALVVTGMAEQALKSALPQLVATPTPASTPTATPTPDLTATYAAEAEQFAIWMATYIATAGVTPTPSPTPTTPPTATPTPDLTATAFAACVFDFTVLNDPPVRPAILAPGQQFTKRWTLRNSGTCPWPEGVTLVFVSGDELEVVARTQIASLAPGERAEVQITLQAPMDYATYTSEWQLQDDQGHPIGRRLKISCYVGPTPTPPPTATPTATPTPLFTATPTERLWMSVPNLVWCDANKSRGRLTWGRGGGPSTEYRYFYGHVAPQFELPQSEREFIGFPHVETYFTTSGTLVWPVPDNCCGGIYGHYRNPQFGYEIVWQQIYFTGANCP